MKRILSISAAVVLFAAGAIAAEFPDITVGDLKSAMASQKVVLLDANGTPTWQTGHIPGAIDFAANKGNLPSLLPSDKDVLVVAYCRNPQCGAYRNAASAAKKLGYKKIKHLVAGIEGWTSAGEKVDKGS